MITEKDKIILRKVEFLGRAGMFFAAFLSILSYYESSEDLFHLAYYVFLLGTIALYYVEIVRAAAKKNANNSKK
tara:strand:- start:7042 stop:7263 length:222 start_codon:yes stop_codon:yes gene_type:complete